MNRSAACLDVPARQSVRLWLAVALAVGLLLPGCASLPTPALPEDTEPAPLIPIEKFFANPAGKFGYKISPDGRRLGWIQGHAGRLTIYYRTIGEDAIRIIDTHSRRAIFWFTWAQDSRRILYTQDQHGDENYHVYLADTEQPHQRPVDLTPFPRTRASIHRVIRSDPEHVIIAHNRRDPTVFDLYRVNLITHEQTRVAENPGDTLAWVTDQEGRVRARIRHLHPSMRLLEVWQEERQAWTTRLSLWPEDFVRVWGYTADSRGMWVTSNVGHNRMALVRLDIDPGAQTLLYAHPRVDVERVLMSERTNTPLMAQFYPDYPENKFFDRELEADLAPFHRPEPTGLNVLSFDKDERMAVVEVFTERGSEWYLLDRTSGERQLLARSAIAEYATVLSTVEPISFESRDRLRLHGYLTLPRGLPARQLPMVLVVHGGPWARDYWRYNPEVQFLANRGYAVLQVNYRGSTGYGRAFREAAVGEFAGKMHDDLIDGVRWAIDKGIADPSRICIYGASYGGYSALVGLTFTPDTFACGVDIVGMSNLVTLLESAPPYWKLGIPLWHKYVGDPRRPEDRQRMEAKSPLFRAHQVKRPLLVVHGANDARVKQQESDQMVAALRQAGKDVEYLLFPDEGHSRNYGDYRNRLRLHRAVEDFLAKHIGGRRAGGT